MGSRRGLAFLTVGALVLTGSCGGFPARCVDDAECEPPRGYCNVPLGACFKRTGGNTVPIIRSVTLDAATSSVTVSGDAPAQSKVNVFLDPSCTGAAPWKTYQTGSTSTFSVSGFSQDQVATVTAYSENLATGSLSVCSPFVRSPPPPDAGLDLSPGSSITLQPSESLSFTATGGTQPYSFSFVANASGGSLTTDGVYTAGMTDGGVQDGIQVKDGSDSGVAATVTVASNYRAPPPPTGCQVTGDGLVPILALGAVGLLRARRPWTPRPRSSLTPPLS